MSTEKYSMRSLLNDLKTKLTTGLTLNNEQVEAITSPIPIPKRDPMIYLIAVRSPKERMGNERFRHIHTVNIIPIKRYADTQETSLIHASEGQIKFCSDIEDVLENNMLVSGGVGQLNDCSISIEEYDFLDTIVDNIYMRASLMVYTATPKIYVQTITQ